MEILSHRILQQKPAIPAQNKTLYPYRRKNIRSDPGQGPCLCYKRPPLSTGRCMVFPGPGNNNWIICVDFFNLRFMPISRRRIVTPQISFDEPRFFSKWLVVGLVLFAAWTWGAYQFGRDGFELGIVDPPEQVVTSGRQLEHLRAEYKALKRRAEAIGKSGQEMSNAQKMATDEISRLQDERTSLIKEISALKESAAEHKLQLELKDIEIRPGIEEGTFDYMVTVEPLQGIYGSANGMLKLSVNGENDGEPEVVNMSEDDGVQDKNRRVFGLHQYLKGTLRFPEEFSPKSVNLELVTGEDETNPLAHSYDWSDVLLEQQSPQEQVAHTEKQIDDLRKKNLALMIKMVKFERAEQKRMAAKANEKPNQLELERAAMAREIEGLKQQVAELKGKLIIKDMSLKSIDKGNSVEIELTVTRSVSDGQKLNGIMTLSLSGQEGGTDKVYSLEQLTSDQKLNYKLGFKNYQEIKESLQIPKGFTPHKILIHIESENLDLDELNEEFDWPELADADKQEKI
jgi:hypothetical protein